MSRMRPTPVAKRQWTGDAVSPADMQQHVDGVGRRLNTQPVRAIKEFVAFYTEPMTLQLESNPIAITLLRVRRNAAPEADVLSGGMVRWVWDTNQARITSIDGLSPIIDAATAFIFTFEAVYAPVTGGA